MVKETISNADSDPKFIERSLLVTKHGFMNLICFENEPKPNRERRSRSKIKVLLTVFFDIRGVVHYEFLPEGQTVNKEYYLGVMRYLREAIRKKRPDLWKNNSWILHLDFAPSHTALIISEFLTKKSTNVYRQAPYSPDQAPCDFFLFPRLKLPLRETIEAIKENSLRELKAIPLAAYKKCMENWMKRWHACIAAGEEYFEGDNNKIY